MIAGAEAAEQMHDEEEEGKQKHGLTEERYGPQDTDTYIDT